MKQWILLWFLSLAVAAENPWTVNGYRLKEKVGQKPLNATRVVINEDRDFQNDPDMVLLDAFDDKIVQISGAELEYNGNPIVKFGMTEEAALKALATRGPLYDMGGSYVFLPAGLDLTVTVAKGKLQRLILTAPIGARPSQTKWKKVEVIQGKLVRRPPV